MYPICDIYQSNVIIEEERGNMYNFQSDYLEGCAPEILEELIKTNNKQQPGYGNDDYCLIAKRLIKNALNKEDVDIHFVPGGTPCNILATSIALKPYEAVICPSSGHINVHETGAIELKGHKILTAKSLDGKLNPLDIIDICEKHVDEHMVKPRMVFISNPTELGSVYTLEELRTIRQACDKYGLYLYMDGARLPSALVSANNNLKLTDIAELTDMFYIGGTKNGALIGEAFVVCNDKLKEDFRYYLKQNGQMLAKSRIIGVSFKVLFTDDLYLKLASHANKTADALKYVFSAFGIKSYCESNTNQQFFILDNKVIERLKEKYEFEIWSTYNENSSVCRFVTSWCTKEEATLEFAADLKQALRK